jgi:hypothetical protein
MAFMSAWEMVRTLCIALSTLPMPKDVVYNYYGNSYGNVQTCEAQAFVLLVATGLTLFSNVFLNLYYLLAIRYNVNESTLKKYLEPIFLVLSLAFSLILPILYLKIEYLNPTPYEAFCNVGIYPNPCGPQEEGATPCIRGEALSVDMHKFFRNFVISMISIELSILIVSMLLIVMTFYKRDVELARRLKEMKNGEAEELNPLRSSRFTSKIIAQQALMYFTAMFLSWSFFAISFYKETTTISVLKQIFFPLRGMMNMFIFVYHKLYALKKSHSNISYFRAFRYLIGHTKNVPEDVVSNLEIVVDDTETTNRPDGKFQQLGLYNLDDSLSESQGHYFPVHIQRCGMDFASVTGDESIRNHVGIVSPCQEHQGQQDGTQDYNSVSMFGSDRCSLPSSYVMSVSQSFEIDEQEDVFQNTEKQSE